MLLLRAQCIASLALRCRQTPNRFAVGVQFRSPKLTPTAARLDLDLVLQHEVLNLSEGQSSGKQLLICAASEQSWTSLVVETRSVEDPSPIASLSCRNYLADLHLVATAFVGLQLQE